MFDTCNTMISRTAMLMTSVHAAFLFALVSSPLTYALTQKIFGKLFQVASNSGAPTLAGLLLHTVVFLLVTYLTMLLHRKMGLGGCGCGCGGQGACMRMYSYEDDMEDDTMDGEDDFEDDDMEDDFEDDDSEDEIYDKSMDMFEDDIEDMKARFTGD